LVTSELKHRIGNLLTVVQAIARQTFKDADSDCVEHFNARLSALTAAQAMLIDAESEAAELKDVVGAALAPHCVDGGRCSISGPLEVALSGRRAHALTLALHELATNAAKYGALSVESGWIEIVWETTPGVLRFIWREHDGPVVAPPRRRGFGSRLITDNLEAAFNGDVELSYRPSGVECRLSASVPE
jgi:two-component sensor histidine kinase